MSRCVVTKEVQFDYGHRIPDHASKCANVHGHRGRVVVAVSGPLQSVGSSAGMVLDFSAIKQSLESLVVRPFDHRLLLFTGDPLLSDLRERRVVYQSTVYGAVWSVPHIGWIQLLPCIPTAENLAEAIFQAVATSLDTGVVKVERVEFWETPTSCATYTRSECSRILQKA